MSYLGTGQRVPEDLERATPARLAAHVLGHGVCKARPGDPRMSVVDTRPGAADSRDGPGMVSLAITSGKGGVGKTNVVDQPGRVAGAAAAIASACSTPTSASATSTCCSASRRDAHLGHVLVGREDASHEILVDGPEGIRIIPASSGLRELTALSTRQWDAAVRRPRALSRRARLPAVDTGAGIADNVLEMLAGANACWSSPRPSRRRSSTPTR